MPVRVSVVVPVYEPGTGFDELIAFLDRQELAPDEFEVLLCDDGSGDETRERLDAVARTRPNIRVLHLPHSGWPGAPRNAGIAEAAGEYVQFVDQDDHLFDGALRALCDYGDRYASDVVIGKEVGVGRRLPRRIFSEDVPHAVLGEHPLLEMLTPHKMFRTSFLRAHRIRFPEGKVRLEDHLFVMQAYFAARTISILASVPCYAWVKHPGSASASRIDPETYFPHLETVLDLVTAHTEPGPLRDRLLRHWYRGKILQRLAGERILNYPDEYRERFLDTVVPLARTHFGPGVERGLALAHRVRSALLLADRRDELVRLARYETELTATAELVEAGWTRGGGLELTATVGVFADGVEVLPPKAAAHDALAALLAEQYDPRRDGKRDRIDLVLRDTDGRERQLTGRRLGSGPSARLRIDPLRVFDADDPSPGGELVARVRRAGWTFEVPVTARGRVLGRLGRSPILAGHPWTLTAGDDGAVRVHRAWPSGRLRDAAGRGVRSIRSRLRRGARAR